jgi:hypothetical protein
VRIKARGLLSLGARSEAKYSPSPIDPLKVRHCEDECAEIRLVDESPDVPVAKHPVPPTHTWDDEIGALILASLDHLSNEYETRRISIRARPHAQRQTHHLVQGSLFPSKAALQE